MCELSGNVAFDKATNEQIYTKHEMGKHLAVVLKIVGEKLPPSQRSSLEMNVGSGEMK